VVQTSLNSIKQRIETDIANQIESQQEQIKILNEKISRLMHENDNAKSQLSEVQLQLSPMAGKKPVSEDKLKSYDDKSRQIDEGIRSLNERVARIESKSVGDNAVSPADHKAMSPDVQSSIDQLKAEMQGYFNSAWNYVQQFADLHAVDKSKKIKAQDNNYTLKLNCLEWLIRYHDYLSGKSSLLVIEAFKEVIHPSRVHERAAYTSAKHTSDVIFVTKYPEIGYGTISIGIKINKERLIARRKSSSAN
jgi:hypothetical protein